MRRAPFVLLVLAPLCAIACTFAIGFPDLPVPAEAGTDGHGADGPTRDAGGLPHPHDAGADSSFDAPADVRVEASAPCGAGAEGGAGDAASVPPSCRPGGSGLSTCGMGSMESCCATLTVTGGTYDRSYDGVSNLSEAGIDCCLDSSNPATVSTFQLDQYEVTVGRFRQFVDAVIAGWAPCPGSGKHSHLNGGKGLAVPGGAYEQGWNASWTGLLATDTSGWNANLSCDSFYESWTPTPASNEALPMNCADWYEMYAFCIWDGGFLPSEAEWNYAAAGGAQQRVYPWSVPPTAMAAGCKYANYSAATPECFLSNPEVVTVYAKVGVGLFGQQNLAGNVAEFALDWYQPYANPCIDCAGLATPDAGEGGVASRVVRGGSFYDTAPLIHTGTRQGYPPTARVDSSQVAATFGARCARAP